MTRFMPFVFGVLVCALGCAPVRADEPPKKLTPEECKALVAKWNELSEIGIKAYAAGKYPEAVKSFEAALEVARRLFPKADFPDGHRDLVPSLHNLGSLYLYQGQLAQAESIFEEALAIRTRLFKGDHPELAASRNSLAVVYSSQGRYTEAEPLY